MSPGNESPQNPRGRLLEYAEFIEEQIHAAQARIKSNDIFRAVLWIITGAMGLLFVEIVLDHSIELPLIVRQVTLFVGILVASVYAWVRIVGPWLRRINPLFAAKSIETVDPQFKNSLINYLQISQDADKVAPSVLAQMEARAVADLSRVDVNNVVDPAPVTRLSYAMAALIVSFCLYSWITPKSLLDSARRAFLADVQRPTNTRFANIRPGDEADSPKAITGMPLEFTVETLGAQPEKVTLFISRDEGKTFAEMEMKQGGSFADPWSVTIEKLPGELLYYMAGGDGRTRTYKLDPVPVAIVEKISLDYDFPEYTAVPRREGVEEGNIEALQGTWITVNATTNQPARSGFLDFKPNPPVPLSITPGDPKKLTGRFLVESNGQYAVRFNSVDGQANPEPVIYDIKVVKDLSPTARFIRPESPTQRPANARVPLVIEASDDFGLKSVQLHVHKNGEILQQAEELIDQKSKDTVKQLQRTVSLDLQPLSVKPGDKVQYWLTLRDNCDLQPNKFDTPKHVIEIIDPVSEPKREELAQNEMAQAREQTGQQDPMNQQGNQSENQQNPDQNPSQNQQNQQPDGKNGDSREPEQKKEQEKQQSKGKNSQGDATEAADPSENAKEGGKEAPNAKPQPSDANNQNQPQSKSKNTGQTGNSSPDNAQNKQQPGQTGGNDPNQQPDSKNADQPKNNQQSAGKNQPKNSGKTNDPNQETPEKPMNPGENPDQPKGNPEQKSENTETDNNQPKSQQKTSEKSPNGEKPQSGQNQPNQPGENGEKPMNQQGDKGENSQQNSGERNSDTKSAQNKQKTGEPKAGDSQKGTGDKPEGDQNQSNELPKGNPDEMKNGELGKNQPRDVAAEDRQKLDKLRKALGLDKEPQEQPNTENKPAGEKPNDPSNPAGEESKQGGDPQKKAGDQEKSGGEQSKDGEKSKQGGDQQKSGDDSKQGEEQGKSAESKKSSGEPKNLSADEPNNSNAEKSGGDSQKKGESQKSGDSSKQGGDQQKSSGDQQKSGDDKPKSGDESKKGGDQEKSAEAKKSGGENAKSGDQQKSEAAKKQDGDQPKSKGQGDGEKPNGDSPDEQQKGNSEKSGEEKGRPGELPKDTPKAGGMREGGTDAEKQADTSTPTARSQEPEQPGESNNLTPQQKADQRVLKRLREMVKRDEITKDLEEATGLSREEIDQFVRRYEPPAKDERSRTEDGPGEILTKQSGQDKERRVNLPANLPGGQVTSRTARNSGMVGEDTQQGNLEGARSRIPSALRARFEAYQKSLSRSAGGPASNAGFSPRGGSSPDSASSASASSGSGQP